MKRMLRGAAFVAAAVVAAMIVVPSGPSEAAAAPTTFPPAADSYVQSDLPTTNFGTKAYVYVDQSPIRTGYLRFDVSGGTDFGSVELQLHAENANSTGFSVYRVADTAWSETAITAANAPPLGAEVGRSGRVSADSWVTIDVTGVVTGDGPVAFAVATTNDTALKITSREGVAANRPRLVVGPAPLNPSPFLIEPLGSGQYRASSASAGTQYTGSVKAVVEHSVADMRSFGGGTVHFTAGTFDLGSEFFKFEELADTVFEGEGMGTTIVRNSTSAAADTEPFNMTGTLRVTVRDLTVSAGGAPRTTSDALDFDKGNQSTIERVEVVASRGRGIVFDGKNLDWTASGNTVRDCRISGTASHGIELLAATGNRIEGCTISAVGGTGIQLNKSSVSADQPNKKASNNVLQGNQVDRSGRDGIAVNGGDRNTISGNTVTSSARLTSGRDGIRIGSTDEVSCDDNVVAQNTATDPLSPKTQRYGVLIATALCHRTQLGPGNLLTGNLTGPFRDLGTGTVIS